MNMQNNPLHVNIIRQRSSGILLPIFSLPGPYGIGDLGPAALRFIDFLRASGQNCWQVLPLGPVNPFFGNSPYMSPSAFAGSPLLISPDLLVDQGLIRQEEIELRDYSEYRVDYGRVVHHKSNMLALAWQRFQLRVDRADILDAFVLTHPWCIDYALFVVLKQHYQDKPWYDWPDDIRRRQPETLATIQRKMREEIDAVVFGQYLFFNQWHQLREYARQQAVHLIGDLPIYVALDSSDVWANQDIFQLDNATGIPTDVAGVPPDYFSATGQRWGNPLYRWSAENKMIRDRLWDWWEQRLRLNFMLTDTVRIDHFRGFSAYWAVNAAEDTAVNGRWLPGPGQPFFEEMERRLGGMSLIAEDLGLITEDVTTLRNTLGYPGMKVLLFAFDGNPQNNYLPYNMEKNSVVYTGTHDNDTAVGWFRHPDISWESKRQAKRFVNRTDDHADSFHQELIHLAFSSPANLAILPMQDVLGLGNDCRLNIPGVRADNWQWRCGTHCINNDIAAWLYDITKLFGRLADK
jgi:4-alpha-glucanotransferase